MLRQFRIATVTLTLLATAGCGIKGPLVLPPPTPAATTAPATTAPPAADSTSKPSAAERKP